jgi:hypothetical protein
VTAATRAPRTAILVLGCLLPVYVRCTQAIRRTWGATIADDVDVLYLYGAQVANRDAERLDLAQLIGQPVPELGDGAAVLVDDHLLVGTGDLWADQADCVLRKRMIAFAHLAELRRYDFVYNVCAGSYVDVETLQRYVRGLPRQGVYHGPVSVCGSSGHPFVSGASMLLSTDVAADLAAHADEIIAGNDGGLPDDVAIGRWVAEHRCEESEADICRRISAGVPATAGEAFVLPFGRGMVDWVLAPGTDHFPKRDTFHYHFHSERSRELEAFHRRYFKSRVD